MSKFGIDIESEQEEDSVEYRQETNPKIIKAIIKAKQISKAHEESILKVIEQQPTPEPKAVPQKKDKPKFIQDDRQRVAVLKQASEIKQKQKLPLKEESKVADRKEKNEPKAKDNKQKDFNKQKKNIQRQQRPDFGQRDEDYITSGHNPTRKESEQIKPQTKKIQYRQKEKESLKNNSGYKPREEKLNKVKQYENKDNLQGQKKSLRQKVQYKQKYNTDILPKKPKTQTQIYNGRQTQLVLVKDQGQLQNQIYIGKRDLQVYLDKARSRLKEFDFIVLKSFGIYVSKTFMVAGLLANEYSSLKQVNIPGTVEVKATTIENSRFISRGSISIELSLHNLDKKHMGYQQSATKNTKRYKVQFKEKQMEIEDKGARYKQKQRQPQKRSFYQEKREQPKRGGKHRERGAQKKLSGSDEERALR